MSQYGQTKKEMEETREKIKEILRNNGPLNQYQIISIAREDLEKYERIAYTEGGGYFYQKLQRMCWNRELIKIHLYKGKCLYTLYEYFENIKEIEIPDVIEDQIDINIIADILEYNNLRKESELLRESKKIVIRTYPPKKRY